MKKRIISFVLALNIIATLSGDINKDTNNQQSKENTTSCEDIDNDVLIENLTINEDIITKEDINNYIRIINSVDNEYKYSDYYPNDKTIKDYKDIANSVTSCLNEDTDYTKLIDIIEENTIKKYGKENGIFIVENEEYSEDELYMKTYIGKVFKDAINKAIINIFNNSTNNTREDICKYKSICIINKDLSSTITASLGIWDNNTSTITIDYEAIVKYVQYNYFQGNKIDLFETLEQIIEHELNHVRQDICKCRKEAGQINDTISLHVNNGANYPSYFLESSAESLLYHNKKNLELNNQSSNDYIYSQERKYETLLFLLTVFKENYNVNGYFNAILDSDLNAFWNYFNLNTDSDLKQFYNIIYAINTMCGRTDLSSNISNNETTITLDKLKEEVGTNYLIDIFKFSTVGLIKAIDRDDLSLDDSLLLYMYVKSYITDSSLVTKESDQEKKYEDKFISSLSIIENNFLNYLSNKYNKKIDIIKNMININESRFNNFIEYAKSKDDTNLICNDIVDFNNLLNLYPIIEYMTCTNKCEYINAKKFEDFSKR